MIQFNLLPDVKQEFIKAKRTKRNTTVIAGAVTAVALAVLIILLLVVKVAQQKHLNDLNADIKKYSNQLQNTPDLNKILTVQNQLNSLPALHDQKPVVSRLPDYLAKITPAKASVTKLHVDFATNTVEITGEADNLNTVNKYADTLKFTTFTTDSDSKAKPGFSEVVLSNFSRNEKNTSYTLTLKFDPAIFDTKNVITLTVPKIITTRSETEKPSDLFLTTPTNTGGH
jgi:uncharacterized protein YoxC